MKVYAVKSSQKKTTTPKTDVMRASQSSVLKRISRLEDAVQENARCTRRNVQPPADDNSDLDVINYSNKLRGGSSNCFTADPSVVRRQSKSTELKNSRKSKFREAAEEEEERPSSLANSSFGRNLQTLPERRPRSVMGSLSTANPVASRSRPIEPRTAIG